MPIPSVADVAQAGTAHEPPGVVKRVVGPGQPADAGLESSGTVRVRFTRLHAHGAATYRPGDVAELPRQAAGHLIAVGACTASSDAAAELHQPAGDR